MAIDWETGKISDEQFVAPEDILFEPKCAIDLQPGEDGYVDADSMAAEPAPSHKVWIHPCAELVPEADVDKSSNLLNLIRIIRIPLGDPAGFIVDASRSSFNSGKDSAENNENYDEDDDEKDEDGFDERIAVIRDVVPSEEGWLPVNEVITEASKAEVLGFTLLMAFEFSVGESLIAIDAEHADDE